MKSGRIALFYQHIIEAAAQTGQSIEAVLTRVRAAGIDYAECDMADLLRDSSIVPRLKAAGMGISSIYGFYDFGNAPDGKAGYAQVELAEQTGCKRIMIIPGFYTETAASENAAAKRERERDNMLAAMREMCEYAAARGIQPTIEDFDDTASPIATAGQMLWFTERIPQLKIAFDTGNFLYSGEDEWKAFERLRQEIVHVHCKDRSLKPQTGCEEKRAADGTPLYPAPVGAGCIRMKEIVTALEKTGYDGIYTIEHFGAGNQLEFIEASVKWLKGCVEK